MTVNGDNAPSFVGRYVTDPQRYLGLDCMVRSPYARKLAYRR